MVRPRRRMCGLCYPDFTTKSFEASALHALAVLDHPEPPSRQGRRRNGYRSQPLPHNTEVRVDHRSALFTRTYMVVIPVVRLRKAMPSMKYPRGSTNSTRIKSRLIAYMKPPTTNGRAARIPAETFASADSDRAFNRSDLRARMTLLRLPSVSAS